MSLKRDLACLLLPFTTIYQFEILLQLPSEDQRLLTVLEKCVSFASNSENSSFCLTPPRVQLLQWSSVGTNASETMAAVGARC